MLFSSPLIYFNFLRIFALDSSPTNSLIFSSFFVSSPAHCFLILCAVTPHNFETLLYALWISLSWDAFKIICSFIFESIFRRCLVKKRPKKRFICSKHREIFQTWRTSKTMHRRCILSIFHFCVFLGVNEQLPPKRRNTGIPKKASKNNAQMVPKWP